MNGTDRLQFVDAVPAPGAEAIATFERYCGFALPSDYQAFLAHHNGSRPVPNVLDIVGTGVRGKLVERFLILRGDGEATDYDIDVVMTALDERIVIDEDSADAPIVPIAALSAGDFACLDYRAGPPTLAYWDHEASDDLAPATYPIAATFSAFLELIGDGGDA